MLREELRQRLAAEFRYAATKMQEAKPNRKLFYFSVLFGETQRILNLEWDPDVALIYAVSFHTHSQITTLIAAVTQNPIVQLDWELLFNKLTEATSDLAAYFESGQTDAERQQLCDIMARLATIAYAASGNGSYMLERGTLKL